jgi:hypothetical protein
LLQIFVAFPPERDSTVHFSLSILTIGVSGFDGRTADAAKV